MSLFRDKSCSKLEAQPARAWGFFLGFNSLMPYDSDSDSDFDDSLHVKEAQLLKDIPQEAQSSEYGDESSQEA